MSYANAIEVHIKIAGQAPMAGKPKEYVAGEDIKRGEHLECGKDGKLYPKKADGRGEGAEHSKPIYDMGEKE